MEPSIPAQLQHFLETDFGGWLIGAIVLCILIERLLYVALGRRIPYRQDAASWVVGIGYFLVNTVGAQLLFFGIHVWIYTHARLFTWELGNPWVWVVFFVLGDFIYYWVHRFEHETRVLWCAHENHHSARAYTFSTAIRMPWGEILYNPIIGMWRPLLGFHPIMYPVIGAFGLINGLLNHTELIPKLGWLEEFLVTPSHHRVHHGRNLAYLDRNYGGRFILWDRMFGTFEREAERPDYGLTQNLDTVNPFKIVVHGYAALWRDLRAADHFRDKLRYLFRPPGWRHDGPGQTTAERRAREMPRPATSAATSPWSLPGAPVSPDALARGRQA